jgi:hypothetical protein
MRRRTFLYAVAASGGIGKARLAKAQTQAMTSPEFPFHVSVETRNDRLLIHYEVENLSSRDVYLYTREVVRNDEIVDAPGVEFDGDRENKTLWVYKVPNVIVCALLYQPIRVLFTPVRAGKRFVDTVEGLLPAREFRHGAAAPEACHERPSLYHGLRFAIRYHRSNPLVREETQKIGDVEVVQPIFPNEFYFDGGRLTSSVIQLDIPVIACVSN